MKIMRIDCDEFYCQIIKIQEFNDRNRVRFDIDCHEKNDEVRILHIMQRSDDDITDDTLDDVKHCDESRITQEMNYESRFEVYESFLKNVYEKARSDQKNVYDISLTDERTDRTTKSDSEAVFTMLSQLRTRRLSITVIISTDCIQRCEECYDEHDILFCKLRKEFESSATSIRDNCQRT